MQDEPYELGPDLLAAQKLPPKALPSGMALEGESGPDPAKFDIMNADDFGHLAEPHHEALRHRAR